MLFLNVLLSVSLVSAADPVQQVLAGQIDIMLKSPSCITDSDLKSALENRFQKYRPTTTVQSQPPVYTAVSVSVQQTSSIDDSAGALKIVETLALGGNFEAIECLNEIIQYQKALVPNLYSNAFVKFHMLWGRDKLQALKYLLNCQLPISKTQQILDHVVIADKKENELETAYLKNIQEMLAARCKYLAEQSRLSSNAHIPATWKEYFESIILPGISICCFIASFVLIFFIPDTKCTNTVNIQEILQGFHKQKIILPLAGHKLNTTHDFKGTCHWDGRQEFQCTSGSSYVYGLAVLTTLVGALSQIPSFLNWKKEQKAPDWALVEYHEKFKSHLAGSRIMATVKLGTTISLIAGSIVPARSGSTLNAGITGGNKKEPDFEFTSDDFSKCKEERSEKEFKEYLLQHL